MEIKKTDRLNGLLSVNYQNMLDFPRIFRGLVCEACGWSTAKFYRQAKSNKLATKAERQAIETIFMKLIVQCTGEELLTSIYDKSTDRQSGES